MMKKVFILSTSLFLSLSFVSCQDDIAESEEILDVNMKSRANKIKEEEPKEVTAFRNKIFEIARSKTNYTDEEKISFLFPVATELLEVHGLPANLSSADEAKTDEEKKVVLGFQRYVELIKKR